MRDIYYDFLQFRDTRVYDFKLLQVAGRRCFGTSFGWLLTKGTDLQINLLHPSSKHILCLPSQSTFNCQYDFELTPKELCGMFLKKAVLSKSPWNYGCNCNCDCILMVIYGEHQQLAFTRPGYKAWMDIKSSQSSFAYIACYKGKFYAVDHHRGFVVCHIDDNNKPRAKVVLPSLERINTYIQMHIQKYLVKSLGDILLIRCFRGGHFYSKVNESSKSYYSENESSDEDSKDDVEDEESLWMNLMMKASMKM